MPESENRTKYAVNPETGQVMRNDGTGWKKVQTAKNQAGDILINENGVWGPVPGRSAQPAPAGFASVPKMSMGQAAQIAGAQGREIGLSDEARGFRAMAGIPEGLNQVYQAVNPLGRFTSIGTGLAGLAGEAMGVMPKSYEQARDVARGELTQARTDRPVTSFLAEMGEGAVYPAGTLRMGAPIVSQSLKMAGIGGLYGGATGYAGAEGDTEQRLGSAALYGGLGAGIGAITPGGVAAALPVFRAGKTAVAKAVDAIVNLFGGTGTASEQAAREVAEAAVRRSMERSNMTPERIAEVVERFRDKPAVLAEVIGQDAINALSSLTRRPGSTSQAAQDIIADRMGGFAGRAADDIRQVTGLTDAQIRGNFAPELQARREAAAPVYEELFQQQGNVASERLTALSSTNTLGPLIRRAQAAAEDLAVTQRRNPASVTPLEVLDLAKRELDDQIATAQRNQQNSELFRLQSLQSALLEELDALTGGQYATARQVGGEAPRLEEARMQGEQALRPSVTRATVQEQVSALNPQDRSFFASGAASKLDEDIAGGRMDPRRFRLPAMQEKVGAAFGDEAGADLTRRMTAEAELRDLAARWGPRQGSITGTVLESGPSEMLDEGIRFATALARGDRIGIVNQAISFMRRRGYTQRQIDEMGRLLLSDPQEGLRRLGVRLPTAPNTGGAAGIAAPNAFTGGSPEGPAGGSGPAGPQGPLGGSMPSGGGVAAMPEANPFAGPQMAPEPAGNAFTSPYFGRQSMRSAVERGPSERILAMQADWAPVSEEMSQASVSAGQAAKLAQQATTIRSGPERQAAAERAAQAMQAVRAQIADIQAQRAGMATPEDQRLVDALQALSEQTNDPVLLSTQIRNARVNLDRVMESLGQGRPGNLIPVRTRLPLRRTRSAEEMARTIPEGRQSRTRYAEGGEPPEGTQMGVPANAFMQVGLGSAGGSVAGSTTDLNGDGVIDMQDVAIGSVMGGVGLPLAGRAASRLDNAFGIGRDVRGMGLSGNRKTPQYKAEPTSVNDSYRNELFAYKELKDVNGKPVAAADINILQSEKIISIRDIVTRPDAKRQGYATSLIEEIQKEFPDYKIEVTTMTDDGAAFFENTFNVNDQGIITGRKNSSVSSMGFGASEPPKPVQRAQAEGYQGTDTGESKEWLSAIRKGLRMDTESRMARAREMGFDTDTVLYHGTKSNFSAFDLGKGVSTEAGLGIHLGDSSQAEDIVRTRGVEAFRSGDLFSQNSQILPVYIKGKNFLRLRDDESWTIPQLEYQLATLDKPITIPWKDRFNKTMGELRQALEKEGYDGIVYANKFEGKVDGIPSNKDSYIIFDPKNIRSVHAAFDPEKSSSPELLAGLPFAVGGAGLGMGAMQSEERPNAFVQ